MNETSSSSGDIRGIAGSEVLAEKPRGRSFRSLLLNRYFAIYWFGQTLSNLGDSFAMIAIPLLVFHATHSLIQMGLVTMTIGIAQLLSSLASGVLVDRVDRRRLMIFCDIGRALVFLTLVLSWWLAGPHMLFIYIAVVCHALFDMCFQVAQVAAIAKLVPSEQLGAANGRIQAGAGVCFVIGPALAGLISASSGPTTAIALDALTFVISAIALMLIRIPHEEISEKVQNLSQFFRDWSEGFQFLFSHRTLRAVICLFSLMTFIMAGSLDIFIYYIRGTLGYGDSQIGLVFGIASIGAILSGVFSSSLRKYLGFGFCLLGGIVCASLSVLGISLTSSLFVITFMAVVNVFSETLRNIISMTFSQEVTPHRLLGRVSSVPVTVLAVVGPIGAALTTNLASRLGPTTMLAIMGVSGLILAACGLFTPVRQRHPEKGLAQPEPE
jgi:MFS family permease